MALPKAFEETLKKVERYGALNESTEQIHERLEIALRGIGAVEAPRYLGHLDVTEWSREKLQRIKAAVHNEICDPKKGDLKRAYKELLDAAVTPKNVAKVAIIVAPIVAAVDSACTIASVVVYLAIWLLKKRIRDWCNERFSIRT